VTTTALELSTDLQRVLCAVNRAVFKRRNGEYWAAPARGTSNLVIAGNQVSELQTQGLVDIVSNTILVPTELGRLSFRSCAAHGHARHMER
jgi:hypothetical protein